MLKNIKDKFMWRITSMIEREIKKSNSKKNYKRHDRLVELQWVLLHKFYNEEA